MLTISRLTSTIFPAMSMAVGVGSRQSYFSAIDYRSAVELSGELDVCLSIIHLRFTNDLSTVDWLAKQDVCIDTSACRSSRLLY
ncbi:hypothetical protein [Egbenema bharatensis]|uniref:hypothetical protein n=1 Tax=Egbenema bharatensis TaxID=3463334 RepID=UPI003A859112